jgi:hypothetical protein
LVNVESQTAYAPFLQNNLPTKLGLFPDQQGNVYSCGLGHLIKKFQL